MPWKRAAQALSSPGTPALGFPPREDLALCHPSSGPKGFVATVSPSPFFPGLFSGGSPEGQGAHGVPGERHGASCLMQMTRLARVQPRASVLRSSSCCTAQPSRRSRMRAYSPSHVHAHMLARLCYFQESGDPGGCFCLGTRKRRHWEVEGSSGCPAERSLEFSLTSVHTETYTHMRPSVLALQQHLPGLGDPSGNQRPAHLDPLPLGWAVGGGAGSETAVQRHRAFGWSSGVGRRATVHAQLSVASIPVFLGSSLRTHPPLSPVCPLWPNAVGTAGLCSFLLTTPPPSPNIQSSVDPQLWGRPRGFEC